MNQNTSFRISRIPRQEKYIASYSRGFYSNWTHYRKDGKFIEFDSWESAYTFLLARCNGNAAFLSLHLCDDNLPDTFMKNEEYVIVKVDQKQPGKDVPTLFDYLLDAHASHKDELVDVQMFYFLRGVLFQWAVEHGESVFELESLFMPDIHYLARQGK